MMGADPHGWQPPEPLPNMPPNVLMSPQDAHSPHGQLPQMMTGEVRALGPHEGAQGDLHGLPPGDAQRPPDWMMDAPQAAPQVRTGAAPNRGVGMNTLLFFGLIVFVVAAAGFVGIAVWGPEKPIRNRTQLATNPPPPTTLPSLADSASASPVENATPPPGAAEGTPATADAASAASGAKKAKKNVAHSRKKH